MGGEGGAWGGPPLRGGAAPNPSPTRVCRLGVGVAGAWCLCLTGSHGALTSHEHVGAGGRGALDAGFDVLVVAAVAARVVGPGLLQQQYLAVGPGVCAFAVSHHPCVLAVLLPCGWCLLSPWPGPLKGVLPSGRGHENSSPSRSPQGTSFAHSLSHPEVGTAPIWGTCHG